jgi:hypothetical protein
MLLREMAKLNSGPSGHVTYPELRRLSQRDSILLTSQRHIVEEDADKDSETPKDSEHVIDLDLEDLDNIISWPLAKVANTMKDIRKLVEEYNDLIYKRNKTVVDFN